MKNYWSALFLLLSACHGLSLTAQTEGGQQQISLENKVLTLLDDLKQAGDRGYSLLPLESKLVKLRHQAYELGIYLEIPIYFLEQELDDLILDEIVEELVSPLSEFQIEKVALLAKNRAGNFIQLSQFLDQPEQLISMALPQNTDPILYREGQVTKKNIPLKNEAQPQGQLNGKTIWLSAGHGWQYDRRHKGFSTQRHNTFGIVEDFSNVEFVNYHLLKYLYQAGAKVWTVRERDMNENEIIIDNDDGFPHYREKGNWFQSRTKGYAGKTYRYAMTSRKSTASATYKANISKSGRYWVSVRYLNGLNRTVDARYRIHHAGGVSEASINQEIHGNTWIYLGQFYFEAGDIGQVELINASTEVGQAVIADAVRFGGGIGTVSDCQTGLKSGEPRYEEGAKYYAAFQGFPKCNNDVMIRPQYAEWELAKGSSEERRNAIYLSIHSNGSGGTGTESYIHSFKPVNGSKLLQQYVHGALIKDIKSGWNNRWVNRGEKAADFGELRGLRTMPGVLVELGFHDHAKDAVALTTPDFRDLAARAIYKGVVKYYAKQNRERPIFLPEAPTAVMGQNEGKGRITLKWQEGKYGGIYGSKTQKYKVYVSHHGRGFADYEVTSNNSFTFKNLQHNTSYYFRVAAVNEGGESFPSAVVAVRTPDPQRESVQYLIVDGFDRLDRSQSHMVYEAKPRHRPLGKVRRLPIDQMNDYSYSTEHGEALAKAGIYFDGIDNNALTSSGIQLEKYDGVDWYTGRESVEDETLSAKERALLMRYLDRGGRLIISGSELGYHLADKGHGRSFYSNYLKANYGGDNSGASKFIGRNSSNFKGLNGHFRNVSDSAYPVNSPDYMTAINGGEALLKYSTGKTAAIGYQGKYGLLHFAFPLEMIADERLRNEMFLRSLEYLHPPNIKQKRKQKRDRLADGGN